MKTYRGSCDCKKVTFEAPLDLKSGTGRCNCTLCTRKRWWGAKVNPPEAFKLLSGKEDLTEYVPGKVGHNFFCKHCGIQVYGSGELPAQFGGKYVSVNAAALDGVTPEEWGEAVLHYMDGLQDAWWNKPKITSYL